MNDKMKEEVNNSAQYIGMSAEEAMEKFNSICADNSLETDNPIAMGLWRNYVAQVRRQANNNKTSDSSSGDSFYKNAFGFFIALEAPRDMMAWNRKQAKEEYLRDADKALEDGRVAVATENAMGKWVISRYHDGEYQERVVGNLPDGAEEHDGSYFIPLDHQATYMSGAENKNYGKPLPVEQYRRSGIFYGSVNGSEMQIFNFSYKNQGGVDFAPSTFEWVHFLCVLNDNGKDIYGATMVTKDSLMLNESVDPESVDYRDMSNFDFEDCLANNFSDHLVPLIEIDRAHVQRQTLPAKEKFIITDGTVCNMNMTPTSNGNRIINITDLNTEFDYENDSGMVTCWVPNHLELDFGIGSSIIVIGRTSQQITEEGPQPVTINTNGVYVVDRRGSVVESTTQPVEEDFDWF